MKALLVQSTASLKTRKVNEVTTCQEVVRCCLLLCPSHTSHLAHVGTFSLISHPTWWRFVSEAAQAEASALDLPVSTRPAPDGDFPAGWPKRSVKLPL